MRALLVLALLVVLGFTHGSPVGEVVKSVAKDPESVTSPSVNEVEAPVTGRQAPVEEDEEDDEDDEDSTTIAPVVNVTERVPLPPVALNESNVQAEFAYVSQFELKEQPKEKEVEKVIASASVPAKEPAVVAANEVVPREDVVVVKPVEVAVVEVATNKPVVDSEKKVNDGGEDDEAIIGTTGKPITVETEFNYTVQYLQDEKNQARIQSEDVEKQFDTVMQMTTQFLSDGEGRAACECGKMHFMGTQGANSGINEFPWTAAIVRGGLISGGRPHCGGTLINDRYVMTSSRCMDGMYPNEIQVWLTAHSSLTNTDNGYGTRKLNVQEILMHPNYNRGNYDNDIALLKLANSIDITSTSYFVPTCLPAGSFDYTGSTAKAVGWASSYQYRQCRTDMPVISNNVCNRDSKHRDKITENMLCAGFLTPSRASDCISDLGSGLVVPNGGRHTLIGLVSWSYKVSEDYSPTVFSRVSAYADWILHNTRDADWCGL